ncbi:hypothetical protein NG798_02835 [Ancylothrix sp. C2]|uniref:hypothetical protein n=1 Tax=Ancylothrix sp. D3o TaxID=2953691 RepID=UPI0021BB833F|nr:hypothetical protein [Ancylothrix sp. D3o]MCT7948717.1 hypothetical protein [Ancylothrix sp. D3o]
MTTLKHQKLTQKTTLNTLFFSAFSLSTGTKIATDQPANYRQPLPVKHQIPQNGKMGARLCWQKKIVWIPQN